MRSPIAISAIFALLTLATAGAAAERVPLQAVIATTPAQVGACGPTCIVLSITGSGHASHLGRTDIDGPSHVDVATGEQTGTSTLTGANGETVMITFSGTVDFGPTPADPVTFAGTFEIVGGTGRFADATGGGTYTGSAAGPAGTLVLDGAISRVGSR